MIHTYYAVVYACDCYQWRLACNERCGSGRAQTLGWAQALEGLVFGLANNW